MILPKNFLFLNIKKTSKLAEFKNLDDSEVFSNDFWAFRNLCSLIDLISLCNLTGLYSLKSPISPKNFLILMVGSSLAPKWPIVVSFYGIHHQKSNLLLILAPFLPEAVEANRCYFFENWVKKLKCPHLLKPLGTIFQHNYWSFYTSEPFTLARFNMRHPVSTLWHYWLWSFKTRDTKLERFLHKNQHTQRKLLNFENWTNGEPQ